MFAPDCFVSSPKILWPSKYLSMLSGTSLVLFYALSFFVKVSCEAEAVRLFVEEGEGPIISITYENDWSVDSSERYSPLFHRKPFGPHNNDAIVYEYNDDVGPSSCKKCNSPLIDTQSRGPNCLQENQWLQSFCPISLIKTFIECQMTSLQFYSTVPIIGEKVFPMSWGSYIGEIIVPHTQ